MIQSSTKVDDFFCEKESLFVNWYLVLLISVRISYAYFSAKALGSESVSTIKAVAANLSLNSRIIVQLLMEQI